MKYTSTRDDTISHTFERALCSGYSPDGGLYVPAVAPDSEDGNSMNMNITIQTLRQWLSLDYSTLCYRVLRQFIDVDEIPNDDLQRICTKSFVGFENCDQIVPVVQMNTTNTTNNNSNNTNNIYVAELYHGPTFCFKDLGMRVVVNMLEYFCSMRSKQMTIVVATTGDTGPAAVQAVADVNNNNNNMTSTTTTTPNLLSMLVHYPYGQISEFQRKQLTTVKSNSVKVVAFEGGGDDMDVPIKHILSSSSNSKSKPKNERMLTGINSYNIGRPLVQMVHFIWTYLRVFETEIIRIANDGSSPSPSLSQLLPALDIVVPTGAMGNMTGAYIAKQILGIPIGKLIAGVNVNDITHRVISTGQFHKNPTMYRTLSEAINIQVPYNFERILYYITNQNSALVRQWMEQMDSTQKIDLLNTEWFNKLQQDFASASATDDEVCDMIRHMVNDNNSWIDPHTAVAWCAAEKLGYYNERVAPQQQQQHDVDNIRAGGAAAAATSSGGSSTTTSSSKPIMPKTTAATTMAIMSTASPCKFQEALVVAVGHDRWEEYQAGSSYPEAARKTLDREEKPPILYKFNKSLSLHENQAEWEQLSRNILDVLGGCGGCG